MPSYDRSSHTPIQVAVIICAFAHSPIRLYGSRPILNYGLLRTDLEKHYGIAAVKFGKDVVEFLWAGLCLEIFRFQRTTLKPAKHTVAFAQVDS